MKILLSLVLLTSGTLFPNHSTIIPASFCALDAVIPTIILQPRYATKENFMGCPVDGYNEKKVYMTKIGAEALANVQSELLMKGLGLKVFDAYRPQRAVDHFVRWCADLNDTLNKAVYYPNLSKAELIPGGYIAPKSGHSRGSTVDLTLVQLSTGKELDMGTPWDYFGLESHVNYGNLTQQQIENRQLLQQVMVKHGFKPLLEEWWHFTLVDEPFPDTYFDFPVE